jgi:membrane dipeptidase
MISRKILAILIPAALIAAVMTSCKQQSPDERALEIHKRILTLDSHTDTPLMLGRNELSLGTRNDPRNGGGKLDFPRMAEGGLDAAFFAVFLSQGPLNLESYETAHQRALSIFGNINSELANNTTIAALALNPDDAYRLKKEGKRAIYLGVENAYPIGEDLSIVDQYYNLGAR